VVDVSESGEQPGLAWEFAQAPRKQLDSKLAEFGRMRFAPNVTRAFSEPKQGTELEVYAQKNLLAGAKTEIEKPPKRSASRQIESAAPVRNR
jgi:hypothetical protein